MMLGSSEDESPTSGGEVKYIGSFASWGPRLLIRGSSIKEIPNLMVLSDCLEASRSLGSCLSMRDLSSIETAGFEIERSRVESTWAVRSVSLSPCSAWGRLSVTKFVSE